VPDRQHNAFGVGVNEVLQVELDREKIIFRKRGEPGAVVLDIGLK
jgi:hypothetical protein